MFKISKSNLAKLTTIMFTFWASFVNAEVEVYRSNHSPRLLLFIHGITGSLQETFENSTGEQFFDLISSDRKFQFSDIAGLGYNSTYLGPNASISNIADRLAEELSSHEKLAIRDYKSVVIVAHSMGGLVIRELLLDDIASAEDGTAMGLASKVQDGGLIFFSVPMDGSWLATVISVFSNQTLANDLSQNSDFSPENYVDRLRSNWRNGPDLLEGINTFCAYETEKEERLGVKTFLVVEPQSAEMLCSSKFVGLPFSHSQMTKPLNIEDDPRYRFATDSYLEIYPETEELLSIEPSVNGNQRLDVVHMRCAFDRFEGERRALSRYLQEHVYGPDFPNLTRAVSSQQYFDWPYEPEKAAGYLRSVWADYAAPRVVAVHYSCFEEQPEDNLTRQANHEDFQRFAAALHQNDVRLIIYTKAARNTEGEAFLRDLLQGVGLRTANSKPDFCLIAASPDGYDAEGGLFAQRYAQGLNALLNADRCPSNR